MCRVRNKKSGEGEREEAGAKAAKLGYFGNFFVIKKGNKKKKIKLKKKVRAVLFLIDKLVVYLSKKN